MAIPWGPIIGAGASLLGGMSTSGQRAAQRRAHNLNRDQMKMAWQMDGQNYQRQKEFAKQGTGWQFADLMEAADEAGIHRLAALGANAGSSYTPMGGSGPGIAQEPTPQGSMIGDAVGEGMALWMAERQMEQQKERDEHNKRMSEAQLKIAEAEADRLAAESRSEIVRARREATNIDHYKEEPAPLMRTYYDEFGKEIKVREGPEWDTIASGAAMGWLTKHFGLEPYMSDEEASSKGWKLKGK